MKSEVILEVIQVSLQNQPKPITHLAKLTGLSPSCIYNIKNGKTKWPKGITMDCLVQILGYEIVIQKKK